MKNANSKSVAARWVLAAWIAAIGTEAIAMDGLIDWMDTQPDTRWSGSSELWLDPTGDEAEHSEASLQVGSGGIDYTWSFRGKEQTGRIERDGQGLRWKDSWHQPGFVQLEAVREHGAMMAGEYSYPAGEGPDWHWRIKLAERPDGTRVLQMTNIAPWGEETRAVRMVFRDTD